MMNMCLCNDYCLLKTNEFWIKMTWKDRAMSILSLKLEIISNRRCEEHLWSFSKKIKIGGRIRTLHSIYNSFQSERKLFDLIDISSDTASIEEMKIGDDSL